MEELDNRVYFVYYIDGVYGIAEDTEDNKSFRDYLVKDFSDVSSESLADVMLKITDMNDKAEEERKLESDKQIIEQTKKNYEILVSGGLSKEAAALISGYKEKA